MTTSTDAQEHACDDYYKSPPLLDTCLSFSATHTLVQAHAWRAHLPPPRHPAGKVVHLLRGAVLHLPVRHDHAVVQAPRLAAVTRVDVVRDLRGEQVSGGCMGSHAAAATPFPTPVSLVAAACLWELQPPRHRPY